MKTLVNVARYHLVDRVTYLALPWGTMAFKVGAGSKHRMGSPGRSGIALAGLVIAVITIRIRREDLAGTPEPAQDRPADAEAALEQARS
jgi:hypothetical protein